MNDTTDKIAVDILVSALYQHLYDTLAAFHYTRNERGFNRRSPQERGAVTRQRAKGIRIAQAMAARLGLSNEDLNEMVQIANDHTAHLEP